VTAALDSVADNSMAPAPQISRRECRSVEGGTELAGLAAY